MRSDPQRTFDEVLARQIELNREMAEWEQVASEQAQRVGRMLRCLDAIERLSRELEAGGGMAPDIVIDRPGLDALRKCRVADAVESVAPMKAPPEVN